MLADPAEAARITAVITEHHGRLRRFAAVVAPIELDPDDLLQEAWVRVLRAGRLAADEASVAAYVRRTIVNLASNERRRLGRSRMAVMRLRPEASSAPSYPSDLAELQRLDPPDRASLYLIEVEGWSHREVAELLGCSEGAARVRFTRARKRLRVELEAQA